MNSSTVSDNQDATAAQYNNLRKDVVEKGGDYNDSTGSANAYLLSIDAQITAYAAGQTFKFKANFTNTGSATLNVNSLGAKTIKRLGSINLISGDIVSGQIVTVIYDGTDLQLQNTDTGIQNQIDDLYISSEFGEDIVAGIPVQMGGTYNKILVTGTHIERSSPAANYNGAANFSIQEYGSANEKWALAKFDLTSFADIDVNNITSAVFGYMLHTHSEAETITLYNLTSDWTDSTVTWNTKPTVGSSIGSHASVNNSAFTAYTIDITTQVKDWIDGDVTNYGFGIMGDGGSSDSEIYSENNATPANRPYLLITLVGGKVYKLSATTQSAIDHYCGFTKESKSAGQTGLVKPISADENQSGLTAGTIYYASDTRGTISSSAGTISKIVGIGKSTTELIIKP